MSINLVMLDKSLSKLNECLSRIHSVGLGEQEAICGEIYGAAKVAELLIVQLSAKDRDFAERLIGDQLKSIWSLCLDISTDFRPENGFVPDESEILRHRKELLELEIEVKKVILYLPPPSTYDTSEENKSREKPIPDKEDAIRALKDGATHHRNDKAKAKEWAATQFHGKRRWFETKVMGPHKIQDADWWSSK